GQSSRRQIYPFASAQSTPRGSAEGREIKSEPAETTVLLPAATATGLCRPEMRKPPGPSDTNSLSAAPSFVSLGQLSTDLPLLYPHLVEIV
ncbi:unnamed protein product, partial [Protopolystoma xenopodis]